MAKTAIPPKTDTLPTAEETASAVAEASLGSQTHTYPDGSSVVGCPPWPEKSPKQRAAEAVQGE